MATLKLIALRTFFAVLGVVSPRTAGRAALRAACTPRHHHRPAWEKHHAERGATLRIGSNLAADRVMHRWDEPKAVGTFFGSNKAKLQPRLTADSNGTGGDVLWDSYLLYGPDARWDGVPTGLRQWGRTIVAARGTLAKEFERMFAASTAKER